MKYKKLIRVNLIFAILVFLSGACTAVGEVQPDGEESEVAPVPAAAVTATPTEIPIPDGYVAYESQSGDTIPAVAAHFGVDAGSIITLADLESGTYDAGFTDGDHDHTTQEASLDGVEVSGAILDPGTVLYVKDILENTTRPEHLFPDSEVVFSPSAVGFDVSTFAEEQGGYLAKHTELMTRGTMPSTEIIYQFAMAHSINPRILLSIMEYESGWVTREPQSEAERKYPMGWERSDRGGIVKQTSLLIREITIGYYSWRDGSLTTLDFTGGETLRLSPYLNAGTVGVMYALSQYHELEAWQVALYGDGGIPAVHEMLLGDPWERGEVVEPLFEAGMKQPEMHLPFSPNQKWSFTCGPHAATIANPDLPPAAALDFAPTIGGPGCNTSRQWATAAAGGLVTRSEGGGPVYIDLDMDGHEQTGWVLYYNHIGNSDRVEAGTILEMDDPIGHPSCVGDATGTHIHIARKYNGEWVLAGGGIPFELSGYRAFNGVKFCRGTLVSGDKTITANPFGNFWTLTIRPDSDPEYLYTPTPRK